MAEQFLTLEMLVIGLGIGFVAAMVVAAHVYAGRAGPERPPQNARKAASPDDKGSKTGS